MKIIRDSTKFVSEISHNFLYKLSPLSSATLTKRATFVITFLEKKVNKKLWLAQLIVINFFYFFL